MRTRAEAVDALGPGRLFADPAGPPAADRNAAALAGSRPRASLGIGVSAFDQLRGTLAVSLGVTPDLIQQNTRQKESAESGTRWPTSTSWWRSRAAST